MTSAPAIKYTATSRTHTHRLRAALQPSLHKRVAPQPLHILALFALLLLAFHHALRPHLLSPRPVLVTLTHGGIGNQMYFLLESMLLSRHANLLFLPPTVPARNIPGLPHQALEHAPQRFWHLSRMNAFTNVVYQAPAACRRGLTTVFMVRRNFGALAPSNRLIHTACLYSGGRRPHETEPQCAQRVLNAIAVHKRYLNFTLQGDHSLIHELRSLRHGCIIVDGHSFSYSGEVAQEYLHSALHYVHSSPDVKRFASKWSTRRMTVLHLRYDEHLCDKNNPNICIRRALSAKLNDTVVYIPPLQLVNAVTQLMRSKKSSHIYIAASPYTPPAILSALDDLFSNSATVLPRVSAPDETMQNFVERELAIDSEVFVGDFASTWSGTVYYKRRTMGKVTEWSCKLLNRCKDLGYYRYTQRLQKPEWFEKTHKLFPSW